MEAISPTRGLRERKKQKTRETIVKVALELFAEQGYDQTTITDIANAAEVSRRTVFAYFPSKEDILFHDQPRREEHLAHALRERPEDATALDAAREFIVGSLTPDDPANALRKSIIVSDKALQRSARARLAPLERLIVEGLAEDLHTGPDDLRPKIIAAALIAAFETLHDPDAAPAPYSRDQAMAVIEEVMRFLHAGLEELRHP
jgi:AcrR family transcriptional regulator